MQQKWVGIIIALGLLAACESAGGLRDGNQAAPPGIDDSKASANGLLVGHRLMAVGEYELALKSYYRAAGEQGMTADVITALGSANLRLGRLGQSERLLRQAVKKDESFSAAWNNLGVVLIERGKIGEAARVFRIAFSLDSGQSADIRENLRRALEMLEKPGYSAPDNNNFALVRLGAGSFRLQSTP